MKHYLLSITLVFGVLAQTSCTRIAHRVAYGATPKTPTQAVSEVVQIKTDIDQYNSSKKRQERQESENRYTAIQEQERTKQTITELRMSVKLLQSEIVTLKQADQEITRIKSENDNLQASLITHGQLIDQLRKDNEMLSKSLLAINNKFNDLEHQQYTQGHPAPKASETVNLGEMTVTEDVSVRKAKNGTVSVRKGSAHTTYTPKASQYYIRGPRGGCYYLTSSGRKQYVDRSLCD